MQHRLYSGAGAGVVPLGSNASAPDRDDRLRLEAAVTGLLALTAAALFTGAAIYVSVAEQPARLRLGDGALLTEWQPSYKRGAIMQASLAILGTLLGLAAWWRGGGIAFLAGAAFMIASWPWTLLVMWPTNKALEAMDPGGPGPETRTLVEKWGRLHLVRALFGAFGTLCFLTAHG